VGRGKTADVVSVSTAGYQARVTVRGHELTVDEPAEDGGKDTGPTPTELLLASVASCYTLSLRWAAKHRNLPLGDIKVVANGTYDGLKFGRIRLEVGGDLPAGEEEALLRDASRVCYVSNTLAGGVDLEVVLAGSD
jgi:putative redox protein